MRDEKSVVEKLIKKHKTCDPYAIAQQRGIIIIYEHLKDALGYFSKYHRISIIHINQNLTELEKTFVCAHELGHAILHPSVNTPFLQKNTWFSISKIEREANTFAVELRLPDKLLQKYPSTPLSALALMRGVPPALAQLKGKNCGP